MDLSDKLKQWAPIFASMLVNRAQNTMGKVKDCDIVVITAGVPRKSDMTRADLLKINANIKRGENVDKVLLSKMHKIMEENHKISIP